MNFDNITSTLTTFTRKNLYEEIKGHQKDVEDVRVKRKRGDVANATSPLIFMIKL